MRTDVPYMSMSLRDLSNEPAASRFTFLSTATALQKSNLRTAAVALTDMVLVSYDIGMQTIIANPVLAGYRERKLLIRAHDPVAGDKYNFTIPGYAGAPVLPGTDFLDLAGINAAAFKAAFEAACAGKIADNLLLLDSIEVTRGQK